jgi:hypothetical protein
MTDARKKRDDELMMAGRHLEAVSDLLDAIHEVAYPGISTSIAAVAIAASNSLSKAREAFEAAGIELGKRTEEEV